MLAGQLPAPIRHATRELLLDRPPIRSSWGIVSVPSTIYNIDSAATQAKPTRKGRDVVLNVPDPFGGIGVRTVGANVAQGERK